MALSGENMSADKKKCKFQGCTFKGIADFNVLADHLKNNHKEVFITNYEKITSALNANDEASQRDLEERIRQMFREELSSSKDFNQYPQGRETVPWLFVNKTAAALKISQNQKQIYLKSSKMRAGAYTQCIGPNSNTATFAVRIKGSWISVGLLLNPMQPPEHEKMLGSKNCWMLFQLDGEIYVENKRAPALTVPEEPKIKSGTVVVVEVYKKERDANVQFYANGKPIGYETISFDSDDKYGQLCFAVELLYSIESAEIINKD